MGVQMADTMSRQRRSEVMSRIRGKNTGPEMAVRRAAHAMGYRYRLHRPDLPGKPDLVFPGRRKVIFVHGCFWHLHSDPDCRSARLPKSNRDYWRPKLERNVARDIEQRNRLAELGWDALILWECEIRTGDGVADRIREFLDGKPPARQASSGSRLKSSR